MTKKNYCETCDCPIKDINMELECEKCHKLVCETCGASYYSGLVLCFECDSGTQE